MAYSSPSYDAFRQARKMAGPFAVPVDTDEPEEGLSWTAKLAERAGVPVGTSREQINARAGQLFAGLMQHNTPKAGFFNIALPPIRSEVYDPRPEGKGDEKWVPNLGTVLQEIAKGITDPAGPLNDPVQRKIRQAVNELADRYIWSPLTEGRVERIDDPRVRRVFAEAQKAAKNPEQALRVAAQLGTRILPEFARQLPLYDQIAHEAGFGDAARVFLSRTLGRTNPDLRPAGDPEYYDEPEEWKAANPGLPYLPASLLAPGKASVFPGEWGITQGHIFSGTPRDMLIHNLEGRAMVFPNDAWTWGWPFNWDPDLESYEEYLQALSDPYSVVADPRKNTWANYLWDVEKDRPTELGQSILDSGKGYHFEPLYYPGTNKPYGLLSHMGSFVGEGGVPYRTVMDWRELLRLSPEEVAERDYMNLSPYTETGIPLPQMVRGNLSGFYMDPATIDRMLQEGVPDAPNITEFIEGRWKQDPFHPMFSFGDIPRDELEELFPIMAREYNVPIHMARPMYDQAENDIMTRGFLSDEAAAALGLYPGFDPATRKPFSAVPILPENLPLVEWNPGKYGKVDPSLWRGQDF